MEYGAIAGRTRRERQHASKKATKFLLGHLSRGHRKLTKWPGRDVAAIGNIRRVGQDLCGNLVTEQDLVAPGVKCIAVKDAMGTEVPQITGLRHARPFYLKARNIVVGNH